MILRKIYFDIFQIEKCQGSNVPIISEFGVEELEIWISE